MKFFRGKRPALAWVIVSLLIVIGGWTMQLATPAEPDHEMTWHFVQRMLKLHGEYEKATDWEKFLTGYSSSLEIETEIFAALEPIRENLDEEEWLLYGRMLVELGQTEEALKIFEADKSDIAKIWAATLREDPARLPAFSDGEPSMLPQALKLGTAYLAVLVTAVLICMAGWKSLRMPSHYWTWTWAGRWSFSIFMARFFQMEALVLVLGIGCFFALGYLGMELSYLHSWIFDSVLQLIMALLLAWLLVPRLRLLPKIFGFVPSKKTLSTLWIWTLWTSAGLVLCGISDFIISKLTVWMGGLDVSDFLTTELLEGGWPSLLPQLFLFSILAPIIEELLFRGLLYPTLRRKIGIAAAMGVTSLYFAILHFYSPLGFLDVFLAGILFNFLYERSGSLVPGMIVHGVYNFWVTLSVWMLFGR